MRQGCKAHDMYHVGRWSLLDFWVSLVQASKTQRPGAVELEGLMSNLAMKRQSWQSCTFQELSRWQLRKVFTDRARRKANDRESDKSANLAQNRLRDLPSFVWVSSCPRVCCGPLVMDICWVVVGSVSWARILYVVYSWYVLGPKQARILRAQ